MCDDNRPMPNIIEPEKAPKQLNPNKVAEAWSNYVKEANNA